MGLTNIIIAEFIKSFENIFSELLISGYYSMVKEKNYSLEMEEEELSAELIKHMENLTLRKDNLISVIPESRYYNEDIYNHLKKPKEAPKPDILLLAWLQSWQVGVEIKYYIEAKNLSESNWNKNHSTNPVNAKKQKERYIETGINNFVTERYPYGCLAGYVVQGSPNKIINDINDILSNSIPYRKSEILKDKFEIKDYPHCYLSYHLTRSNNNLCLRHFLLKI